MSPYSEFHRWLFPGDDLRNPSPDLLDLPEGADILSHVAECTGVKPEWLEKSVANVLRGVAGLQCLWYLDGATGSFHGKLKVPDTILRAIADFISVFLDEVELAKFQDKPIPKTIKYEYPIRATFSSYSDGNISKKMEAAILNALDYDKGTFTVDRITLTTGKVSPVVFKVGKILREVHEDSKEFEQRGSSEWNWIISTHPFDVLTMSFRRSWTSCMRPPGTRTSEKAGVAEFGPLTDMASGSAIMFFYRKGATDPAARLILRPGLSKKGDPVILHGGELYPPSGGPDVSSVAPKALTEMLAEATGTSLEVIKANICTMGHEGRALVRSIYSDTGTDPRTRSGHCEQRDSEYISAYKALGSAPFPSANEALLEGTKQLRSAGTRMAAEYGSEESEERASDAVAAGIMLAEDHMRRASDLSEALQRYAEVSDGADEWAHDLDGFDEDDFDDIGIAAGERASELIMEFIEHGTITIHALYGDPDDLSGSDEESYGDLSLFIILGAYTDDEQMSLYNRFDDAHGRELKEFIDKTDEEHKKEYVTYVCIEHSSDRWSVREVLGEAKEHIMGSIEFPADAYLGWQQFIRQHT